MPPTPEQARSLINVLVGDRTLKVTSRLAATISVIAFSQTLKQDISQMFDVTSATSNGVMEPFDYLPACVYAGISTVSNRLRTVTTS